MVKENDLEVIETIVRISARLVANKTSYKFKHEQIKALASNLAQQLQAEE